MIYPGTIWVVSGFFLQQTRKNKKKDLEIKIFAVYLRHKTTTTGRFPGKLIFKYMKRYFVEKKEITEEQAMEIEKRNREIMESGDFISMLDIKLIVVI